MKKTIQFMILIMLFSDLAGQNPTSTVNPFPKTITVSGSAEIEIIPDEIFVNISLREYQKRGEDKKDIEMIKTQFLENCKISGIPDSLISIVSFTGLNNYYHLRKKKKDPNLMASIVYQVEFNDSRTMDILVEKLDDEATQTFQIVAANHSKMTQIRKDLKIKAVQAAKEKGIYLTDAINEKLGAAITINEPDDPSLVPSNKYSGENVRIRGTSSFSNGIVKYDQLYAENDIDFKKIKLRFEVIVIFALQ